jgi:hypothetical protein
LYSPLGYFVSGHRVFGDTGLHPLCREHSVECVGGEDVEIPEAPVLFSFSPGVLVHAAIDGFWFGGGTYTHLFY